MITLGDHDLHINELIKVSSNGEECKLGDKAIGLITESNNRLNLIVSKGTPVYGINTGFGVFSDKKIKKEDIELLNRNLIISHAVGTGTPLPNNIVRAAMLVRANTLAKGFSGIRLQVINTIIEALNHNLTPIIPSQGSLGSSGDLCPLSHLALVFSKDLKDLDEESGYAYFDGSISSGKRAMADAGIERIVLGPKEGLALNNGATFSAAIMAIASYEAQYLVDLAEKSIGLTVEALRGSPDAFDSRIHLARGLDGQIESANIIQKLITGSELVGSASRIQDIYSIRCAPQIHGGIRDTIKFVGKIVEKEINAATDNPLIFEPSIALSGGNFHGEPIALVADYLGIALCELGAISERRIFRLLDGKNNDGLPSMLVDSSDGEGLNSGIMILQYTAASLTLENQTLASPDSVHSLPTSGGQEDHNANAMTAARHALEIVYNLQHILSIELFAAARAINLRKQNFPAKLGKGNQVTFDKIRSQVEFVGEDCLWGKQVDKLKELVKQHLL
jgi:histidine ammonia-lyase